MILFTPLPCRLPRYNRLYKSGRQLGAALEADVASQNLALAAEEALQHRSRPAAEQQVSTVTAGLLLLRHQSDDGTRNLQSGVLNPCVTGSRLQGGSAVHHRGLQSTAGLGLKGGPNMASDIKPHPRQESLDPRYTRQQQQQQQQQAMLIIQ